MSTPTRPVADLARSLTPSARAAVIRLADTGDDWWTCAQLDVSGTALTLLCFRDRSLARRRWATWKAAPENNMKRGEGFTYRLSVLGTEVAAHLASLAPDR